jgi:ribosome-associated heat shock protein Hsp15
MNTENKGDLKVRLDKYLWAIRIYKTRSQAGDAIDSGKVKLNGEPVKSSHIVKKGEHYYINTKEKKWQIVVLDLLDKRMKAALVAPYYKDITPAEELERIKLKTVFSFDSGGKYSNKSARPTKKDRRDLDELHFDSEE